MGGATIAPAPDGQATSYVDNQRPTARYLEALYLGSPGGNAPSQAQVRADLAYWHLAAIVAVLLLDRLLPPDLSRYHDRSVTVLARDGTLLHAFTTADGKWRLATTADAVGVGEGQQPTRIGIAVCSLARGGLGRPVIRAQ